jgi:hypothetical protein
MNSDFDNDYGDSKMSVQIMRRLDSDMYSIAFGKNNGMIRYLKSDQLPDEIKHKLAICLVCQHEKKVIPNVGYKLVEEFDGYQRWGLQLTHETYNVLMGNDT